MPATTSPPAPASTPRGTIAALCSRSGGASWSKGRTSSVSTCSIPRGEKLLAVLSAEGSTSVVFEAPEPELERYGGATENVTFVPTPVTEQTLLDAVERAQSGTAEPG